MAELSRRAFLGGLAAGALGTLLAVPSRSEASDLVPLLECHVAGTSYRPNGLADIEPSLVEGAVLRLEREPENPADDLAIAVYDPLRRHLGYVPRAKNQVLARLMDAGYLVVARLDGKTWSGNWLKLDMTVLIHRA